MATCFNAPQPAAGCVYGSMRGSGFFMAFVFDQASDDTKITVARTARGAQKI
jgi:hypothetical protein